MLNVTEIEAALREALPLELQATVSALARLIVDMSAGTSPTSEPQAQPNEMRAVLAMLAGREVPTSGSVLSFGEGNEVGDVHIRDVAGHNIIRFTIAPHIHHHYPPDAQPLFRKNDVYLSQIRIDIVASHLEEWKIVHTHVQGLLLSVPLLRPILAELERRSSTKTIYNVEDGWFQYCEPRAQKTLHAVRQLRFVSNASITYLISLLQGDLYVAACIRQLKVRDTRSISHLKHAIYSLEEQLKEVLTVADLFIVQIAEHLKIRLKEMVVDG
jgi:hypothetical protein